MDAWLDSQSKVIGSMPTYLGNTLTPPWGARSQRQMVPETMNDSDMGYKKMVRRTSSPLGFWSRRMAMNMPSPTAPTRSMTE